MAHPEDISYIINRRNLEDPQFMKALLDLACLTVDGVLADADHASYVGILASLDQLRLSAVHARSVEQARGRIVSDLTRS